MRFTTLRRPLARLARLSPLERSDLARAQWALLAARLELLTRPRGTLVRREGTAPPAAPATPAAPAPAAPATVAPATVARARELETAVRRVAEHGPMRTTCLIRASALQRLLEHEGIRDARLRVGVRSAGGEFAAHAWLELGDVVLGDRPRHVRTFTPVGLRLVGR